MKNLLAPSIVVGLFLLMGCRASHTPQPGPVTNANDIVGIWDGSDYYAQYNQDGTFRFAPSTEELEDRPRAIGEFWFEGGLYFEKEIESYNLPSCGNTVGSYEVRLLENGNLLFTEVDDKCWERASFREREHKRVE